MNDFVAECRSEWRRLGVPAAVADEMAAELATDLEEAESEGVSAEDVLGTGAFDPRSFAAAWASERGVTRHPAPHQSHRPRRSVVVTAFAALALTAIVGAVLAIVAGPSAAGSLVFGPRGDAAVLVTPDGAAIRMPPPTPDGVSVTVDGPRSGAVWVASAPARLAVDVTDSGFDARTLGLVLLIAGLAGFVPLTVLWLWAGAGRGYPSGPAY